MSGCYSYLDNCSVPESDRYWQFACVACHVQYPLGLNSLGLNPSKDNVNIEKALIKERRRYFRTRSVEIER